VVVVRQPDVELADRRQHDREQPIAVPSREGGDPPQELHTRNVQRDLDVRICLSADLKISRKTDDKHAFAS